MKHLGLVLIAACVLLLGYSSAEEMIACTMEYAPVCGEKQVQCVTTPCDPVIQTYGNRCGLDAAGAKFLYEGECKEEKKEEVDLTNCTSYFDGCNTCFVTDGEIGGCTRKYCPEDMMKEPTCLKYEETEEEVVEDKIIGMPNPASMFCTNLGGTTNLDNSECSLPEGKVCDERALFRRECTPNLDHYSQKLFPILDKLLAKYEKKGQKEQIVAILKKIIDKKLEEVQGTMAKQDPDNLPKLQKRYLIFVAIELYLGDY